MELIALGLAGSLIALLSWLLEFITQRPGPERSVISERITPQRLRTTDHRFSNGGVMELRSRRLLDAALEDHGKSFRQARDAAS